MIKAAALLIALPLMAAGDPHQISSEQLRKACYQMVDQQWQQYRMDKLPNTCGQSFECTAHETHRYDVCDAIR